MTTEEQRNIAWIISRPGHLTQRDYPIPTLGPHQALVRVAAVSLNYRDHVVLLHSPKYPFTADPDLVPGSDCAGMIVSGGPNSRWGSHVGEKVIVHPHTWIEGDMGNFKIHDMLGAGSVNGTLTRYLVVDDDRVKRAPKQLTVEEASTISTAGLTAWNALFEGPMPCRPGMTFLTQGTGGVSCFAIQLAVAAGATVIATSSSNDKLEIARRLGAKHLINYRERPIWSKEVLRITNGRGVDHVVDVAGASSIEESLHSVRQGGLVSVLGILSDSKKTDLIPLIMLGGKSLRGVTGAGSAEMLEKLVKYIEKHDVHPVIAKVFEFDQAASAFEKVVKTGEVVVSPDSGFVAKSEAKMDALRNKTFSNMRPSSLRERSESGKELFLFPVYLRSDVVDRWHVPVVLSERYQAADNDADRASVLNNYLYATGRTPRSAAELGFTPTMYMPGLPEGGNEVGYRYALEGQHQYHCADFLADAITIGERNINEFYLQHTIHCLGLIKWLATRLTGP